MVPRTVRGEERGIFNLLENSQGSGASEAPQEAPGSVSRGFEEPSVCAEVVQDILVGPKYITFKNDPKIDPKMTKKWSQNAPQMGPKIGSKTGPDTRSILEPSWGCLETVSGPFLDHFLKKKCKTLCVFISL